MSMVKPPILEVIYDLRYMYCVRVIVLGYIGEYANACIVSRLDASERYADVCITDGRDRGIVAN